MVNLFYSVHLVSCLGISVKRPLILISRSCLRSSNENEAECVNPRKLFADLCPPTWVSHFDRKFQYEKFKANLAKGGYEELDQKYSGDKKQE